MCFGSKSRQSDDFSGPPTRSPQHAWAELSAELSQLHPRAYPHVPGPTHEPSKLVEPDRNHPTPTRPTSYRPSPPHSPTHITSGAPHIQSNGPLDMPRPSTQNAEASGPTPVLPTSTSTAPKLLATSKSNSGLSTSSSYGSSFPRNDHQQARRPPPNRPESRSSCNSASSVSSCSLDSTDHAFFTRFALAKARK
jgi:hypothetical protein